MDRKKALENQNLDDVFNDAIMSALFQPGESNKIFEKSISHINIDFAVWGTILIACNLVNTVSAIKNL